MSKILITGGAGFIGSHLADRFLADGHKVVILDNLSSGRKEYIPRNAEFHLVDLKDEKATVEAVLDVSPDVVSHHAAQVNVRISLDDPITDANENIMSGLNLIRGALEARVKRFIFASTGGAIYGNPPNESLPVSESAAAIPLSPYGAAKLAMEHYTRVLFGLAGIPYVILRYSNVYGPRQVIKGESGVVAIFTKLLIEGRRPTIFGDGTHTRDYVYIKDVVEANVAALSRGDNRTFNIGTTTRTDVNQVFERIRALTGSELEAIYGDEIPGEVEHTSLDTASAREGLGWEPSYAIDDALPETIEYYQSLESAPPDE